jgi:hypothetical protein
MFQPMTDRRYTEEEIAAIFRTATEGLPLSRPYEANQEGLALADLQAIGREVGISPDAVARAAVAIDTRRESPTPTLLGLPVGVARTIELGRRMTDDEWERFVVQLREVFNATGTTRSDGSLRQWSNGNLRVMLEPTDTGHRLRFRTRNASATASIRTGAMGLLAAAAIGVSGVIGGHFAAVAMPTTFVGFMGLAMFANGAFRLPGWARRRARQMEALAARAAMPPALPSASNDR